MNSIIRTNNYKKQVIISFGLKGLSVLLNLWQISLLYKNLDLLNFSIWTTIISFTNWVLFFDIGIGNGLRNKIAESLVTNKSNIKIYVSNAYAVSIAISLLIFSTNIILYYTLDWNKVYNTILISGYTLGLSTFVALSAIIINLVLSLITSLLYAQQKSSLTAIPGILYNIIFVVGLFMYDKVLTNIVSVSFFYFFSIVISGFVSTIAFYLYNKDYIPNFKNIKIKYIKELFSVSIYLFVISLGPLFLNFSDNIIISQFFGVEYVGNYNILFRLYFSVYTTVWLLIVPLWSASSEAYLRGDYLWIKERIRMFIKLMIPLALVLIILSLKINLITELWLNKKVEADYKLLIALSFFVLISYWNSIFSGFLNGINKLTVSLIFTGVAILLNFILSYVFGVLLQMKTIGVILATVIAMLPFSIMGSIYAFNILSKKTK